LVILKFIQNLSRRDLREETTRSAGETAIVKDEGERKIKSCVSYRHIAVDRDRERIQQIEAIGETL